MITEKKYILNRNDYKTIIDFVREKYSVNLSLYAYTITKRRIEYFFSQYNIENINQLINFLDREKFWISLYEFLIVPTTEAFRDSDVWSKFSKKVLPKLSGLEKIKIWMPEVSSDDELFTLLVILYEAEILSKTSVLITSELDKTETNIKNQKFNQKKFTTSKQNYLAYNPHGCFENYFSNGNFFIKKELFENVTFSRFCFTKNDIQNTNFDIIIFRNRMLYYSPLLQKTALDIIYEALIPKGFLLIGLRETLNNWALKNRFNLYEKDTNIFQKKK